MTPEGFNSRLTFLHQCTRQGSTITNGKPDNLVFGKPPVCILRIGDFYYTKIIIESVSFSYEPLVWDLNPEGAGVQPMICTVDMSFAFIGGSSLDGPINRLQNALSFNYYANTGLFSKDAEPNSIPDKAEPITNVTTKLSAPTNETNQEADLKTTNAITPQTDANTYDEDIKRLQISRAEYSNGILSFSIKRKDVSDNTSLSHSYYIYGSIIDENNNFYTFVRENNGVVNESLKYDAANLAENYELYNDIDFTSGPNQPYPPDDLKGNLKIRVYFIDSFNPNIIPGNLQINFTS